jgi:hypothetical protein
MSLTWKDVGGTAITTGASNPGEVNTEYTATFTFTDNDVRAVYVDWDDGESNKKTESNYQWIESTEPILTTTATHTYNKQGTFLPVVQVINSKGIASRYYSNEASNTNITPHTTSTLVSGVTINDIAATGIMRVENRTIKSGIDNSIFEKEGPKQIFVQVAPTMSAVELGYVGNIALELECIVARSTVSSLLADGKMETGYSKSVETIQATISNAATQTDLYPLTDVGTAIERVLSVKYKNPKLTGADATDYTKNAATNKLKIFIVGVTTPPAGVGSILPITYVSTGSPYKEVEDVDRYITLDFSQSRPSASNATNSYYFYDDGKGWFGSEHNRWALSAGKFTDATKQASALKSVYYTYQPRTDGIGGYTLPAANPTGSSGEFTWPFGRADGATTTRWVTNADTVQRTNQFALDDYGRFFDQYHLVRNSMQPSTGADYISSISGNAVTLARITPTINFDTPDKSCTFDGMGFGVSGCYTKDYTAQAFNNSGTNADGLVSLSGANIADFMSWSGTAVEHRREANEYLIALWDAKTNQIFFECTPWWNDDNTTTSGLKIGGVSYLKVTDSGTNTQTCEWVPLEFEDGTKSSIEYRNESDDEYQTISNSFTKSGIVSFDMPSDWSSIQMQELYGGKFNTANTASDSANAFTTAVFSVSCSAAPTTKYTQYGYNITFSAPGDTIKDAMSVLGSSEDVGAFKYMIQIVTHTNAAGSTPATDLKLQNLWCAKLTDDSEYGTGWDGINGLYGQFGIPTGSNYELPSNGDKFTILVRRVNVYEVFPGASKLYNKDDSGTDYQNPVDAGVAAAFPNDYVFTTYSSAGSTGKALKDAWNAKSKYPLMITISGQTAATTHGGAATNVTYYNPEIWNVLDATEGFTSVVKHEDDTAYNLNSIPLTSDVSVGRGSNFYQAITRKGKVFISKTGIQLEQIGFNSKALGDESSSSAFDDHGPSTMYGYLHMVRKLQADAVRIFWDEKQKDGTYVRFWGVIKNVNETRQAGGPRAIVNYTFTMTVQEIALLSPAGELMTDLFPLGGIEYERSYS